MKPESNQSALINRSLMEPIINQPIINGIAKTHKFDNLEDITVVNLDFQLITDQALILITNYLRSSCKN